MSVKIKWRIVLLLVATLAVVFVEAISHAFRASWPPQNPDAKLDAHAVPLDFADERVRETLFGFSLFNGGLETISHTCDSTKELYRIVIFPGLSNDDFIATDMAVSGNVARLVQRRLGTESPSGHDYAWHVVSNSAINMNIADAVRSDAIRLLRSGVPATDGPPSS